MKKNQPEKKSYKKKCKNDSMNKKKFFATEIDRKKNHNNFYGKTHTHTSTNENDFVIFFFVNTS